MPAKMRKPKKGDRDRWPLVLGKRHDARLFGGEIAVVDEAAQIRE